MKYIITRYKRETRMYKTVLEARLWNITRLDILSRYISFTSFSDTIRCIWIYPPPCSTIRLWNLREEIYISFSIFIIKMYIYVYFHRSATRNTYCVTTHPPPHTLHPLPSPSITSDLQEVLAYASLFIRTWGREYVVCNMRATSRAYFFLLLHSTLHSPLA